jgi:hypothetical protein
MLRADGIATRAEGGEERGAAACGAGQCRMTRRVEEGEAREAVGTRAATRGETRGRARGQRRLQARDGVATCDRVEAVDG